MLIMVRGFIYLFLLDIIISFSVWSQINRKVVKNKNYLNSKIKIR